MRPLRAAARVLGVAFTFVVAAGGGVLLHLDVPPVQRAIVASVNRALASALPGRVTIERLHSVGPEHVSGVDAHVDDPDGTQVLRIAGARARLSTMALVRSLLGGGDRIVELSDVSVDRADVNLDTDAAGQLRLVRAFVRQSAAGGPSRGVRLVVPHARVDHAVARGRPDGSTAVDADVDALDAAVAVRPDQLALEVAHATVTARDLPGGFAAKGDVRGRIARPSPLGRSLGAQVDWSGTLGSVAASAAASYDGGKLDVALDVPRMSPEELRTIWPSSPLAEATDLHAEAHGELPSLFVEARAHAGRGELGALGPLVLGTTTRGSLRVYASSIDARALSESAPTSNLTASGDVLFATSADGRAGGAFAMELAAGTVGGGRTPAVVLRGDASRAPGAQPQGHAVVSVREPGAPARLALRLVPAGSSLDLAFEASVDAPDLGVIARLGAAARGSAQVAARGTLHLADASVDADVDAKAEDVDAGAVRLRAASLQARARGPLIAPRIDADVQAEGLEASALKFETAHASAHGSLRSAPVHVELHGHGANVVASAEVGVAEGASLRDLWVAAERGGVRAVARAKLVRVAGPEVRVDDLVLEGFGAPLSAALRASPAELTVHAVSGPVDLARIARFVGAPRRVRGLVSLEADATFRKDKAQGHAVIDVDDAVVEGWPDAKGHFEATVDGRRASGRLNMRLADIGSLDLQADSLQVAATAPLLWSSWRKAWGAVDCDAHVDLGKLAARAPPEMPELRGLAGIVDVRGRVERDSAQDLTPEVEFYAKTAGLVASGSANAPWRLQGVDASAHMQVDGHSGATSIDAQVADGAGTLAAVDASSTAVPYAQLLATDKPLLEVLRAMPFTAHATIPARDVADLPALFGTKGLHGELQASASFHGTLLEPTLDVSGSLAGGRTDVALLAMPLDLDFAGSYDGSHAGATVHASTRERSVLDAEAKADVLAKDALDAASAHAVPPWKGSAHATLTDFPLQSVAALDDRQVRGRASGEVAIDGLHEDASASLELTVDDLHVGDLPCRSARMHASLAAGVLEASGRIDHLGGYAQASTRVGATWGTKALPTIDTTQPIDASITASQFRAGLLLPMMPRVFAQLDGRVDANARISLDPRAKTVKPQGTIALHDGVLELTSVGGEFHDVSAKITLRPDGVVTLEEATAKGLSGKLQAAATARFAAGAFVGARGVLQVPRQEPLPLIVDGVQLGVFDGNMTVAADPAAGHPGLNVTVDVPSAHVQVPLASTHDVQSLGDIPGVRVGIGRGGNGSDFVPVDLDSGDKEPASGPASGAMLRVALNLGKDVEVKRGTDVDVRLEGSPSFTIQDGIRADGQIRLTRGKIDVQGKPFTIDDATVTFLNDPTNPQVMLRATWQAPDAVGTMVHATFIGPLKTGKVKLTSDPLLPENQILSLILFGTTDEQASTGTGNSAQANTALGAAGGAATAPINRALGGLNHALDNFGLAGGLTTKVDTSQTTPRPEIELQIARDLSLQVAWVIGVPPPGTNPDSTLFTLAWRFARQWSLETTVGDAGTSILDFVWQHKY